MAPLSSCGASSCTCFPEGSCASRHFGFLANRFRVSRLALSRRLLSSNAPPPVQAATCQASSETSSVWHCPRCGAAMILEQRFTAAGLSTCTSSIRRSACLTTAPAMCSGTSTHSCVYPTATGSRAGFRAHSCRHVRRCHRSRTRPFPFDGACPTLDLAANWHSNPIAHRVRRKRQRLPPSLLIENASDRDPRSTPRVCPEAFPIKASDKPSRKKPIASWNPSTVCFTMSRTGGMGV